MNIWPLLVGGFLAYTLRNKGKQALDRIEVRPVGKPELSLRGLKIYLEVFNPTPIKVRIQGIDGFIFTNQATLATFSQTDTMDVNPGKTKIAVFVKPTGGLVDLIRNKAKGIKQIGISYTVRTALYNVTGEKTLSL